MDLKIKDVAELLHVSETTIRRWLADGKIPAYRLNHQYRFSLMEIENWMMGCKLEPTGEGFYPFANDAAPVDSAKDVKEPAAQRGGMQQFSLYRAISKGGVFAHIPGEAKEDVIRGTMKWTAQRLGLDSDVMTELLLDREKLMPTALNHGIAVPHTRDLFPGPEDIVIVVFPQKPIAWGALDGQPVHTLFFLFSSTDKRHLHLLAKLAHLSSHKEALDMLKSKPPQNKLLDYIRQWEADIRQPVD